MKRFWGYTAVFTFACLLFAAGYYSSYKRAYDNFAKKQNQTTDKNIDETVKNAGNNLNEENMNIGMSDRTETGEIPASGTGTEVLSSFSKINAGAKLTTESYYIDTGESTFEEGNVPPEFVGLTRKELIGELYEYMLNMPLAEYEQGLYSYEITYFSNREITLKKCYNPELITFKYYVAVKDGYVIVYYCDLKTVYEYTSIVAAMLPEKERNRLMAGIYLKTTEDLYELLENYSS